MKTYVIGISGGSGSGKTTIVNEIVEYLGTDNITVIKHDDYYRDQSHLTMEERCKTNYDHPASLENDLLVNNIKDLVNGKTVIKPTYDFVNHTRASLTEEVKPSKIVIVEGILVLEDKKIRDLLDLKIFVECDLDTMFIRRLKRDITERGRTMDSVVDQYLATVKPMYYKFVKPSKRYADVIIPNHITHDIGTELVINKIKSIINE